MAEMPKEPDIQAPARPRARRGPGLSGKLLLLTLLFVMLAEVLIYVPSIANFRLTWLAQRMAAAQTASLALKAAPDLEVSEDLARELLTNAEVLAVVLTQDHSRRLILNSGMPPEVDRTFDLRDVMRPMTVFDAFDSLFAPEGRIIAAIDNARFGAGETIQIVFDETPLKRAMLGFSLNILSLSIVISLITASLVYLVLNWQLVRPIRRLTGAIMRFAVRPEDSGRVIRPSGRRDEIGVAESELAKMQNQLQSMLQQKANLAALGLAVSKINHDLRNMLAHAQLLSDRLTAVKDPTVQTLAPKLVGSLDRAIELCSNTLKFGKAQEAPPSRRRFRLAETVAEVAGMLEVEQRSGIQWADRVDPALEIDADPDHLFRILMNLVRNAVEAIEAAASPDGAEISISARREGSVVFVQVCDTGPGVPETVRANLFEAFKGTGRPGGVGLGLAIAAELTHAHGGEMRYLERNRGAGFEVEIPDMVTSLDEVRQAGARS